MIQPLWEHQKKTIEEFRHNSFFGLFYEMGTGKTRTAIECYTQKCQQTAIKLRLLVLCPIIVMRNWEREFGKYSELKPFANIRVIDQASGGKKASAIQSVSDDVQVLIVNHEALLSSEVYQEIHKQKFDFLIIDESHRFKNPSAKRTKALIKLADTIRYKLILTGSPVLQSALDLWSQFRVLCSTIFPENFFTFRSLYFYDANSGMPKHNYFPNWKPRPGSEAKLNEIIGKCSHRVEKSQAIDLPPLLRETVLVPLLPEQARHYYSMDAEFLTYLEDSVVTADITLTKMLRLQQICSGILATQDHGTKKVENLKLNTLEELLKDLTTRHKVIVWTSWRDTYSDIAEVVDRVGVSFAMITGDTPQKDRDEAMRRFNEDDDCRVFIGNQAAAGVGCNLQAASYMIYYSKTYNLEHDLQSEARNYRGGSEVHEKITRIDLVTEGTIEEEITEALWNKKELGEILLNYQNRMTRGKVGILAA